MGVGALRRYHAARYKNIEAVKKSKDESRLTGLANSVTPEKLEELRKNAHFEEALQAQLKSEADAKAAEEKSAAEKDEAEKAAANKAEAKAAKKAAAEKAAAEKSQENKTE